MRAVAIAVLMALAAEAQEAPADAPVMNLGTQLAPDPAGEFKAGEIVPYDAVCLGTDLAIKSAKRIVACEATVAEAEKGFLLSKPVLILGIAGVFVLGGAVGAAAILATNKKSP